MVPDPTVFQPVCEEDRSVLLRTKWAVTNKTGGIVKAF